MVLDVPPRSFLFLFPCSPSGCFHCTAVLCSWPKLLPPSFFVAPPLRHLVISRRKVSLVLLAADAFFPRLLGLIFSFYAFPAPAITSVNSESIRVISPSTSTLDLFIFPGIPDLLGNLRLSDNCCQQILLRLVDTSHL